MSADGALIVFARLPVPGRAKTRLVPALGPEGAARLQARLCDRTVATALAADAGEVLLFVDAPPGAMLPPVAGGIAGVRVQHGDDLGERMHAAFVDVLLERPRALLIGTDCPARTAAELRWAAGRLAAGDDAVLGPVFDGGYSLIGLRRPREELFCDMPWSTPRVLGETRSRLRAAGLAWSELALTWDLDEPSDLARLDGLQPPLA